MEGQQETAEWPEWPVRQFSATVNGKRRQVLMPMPPGMENNVEEGYLNMMAVPGHWDVFWGYEGDVNPEATTEDHLAELENMKLTRPRLS